MKTLNSLALRYTASELWVLDQTRLPHSEIWISCKSPEQMAELIKRLAVRGAPLIGVAAALSLAHYAEGGANADELRRAASLLRQSRPTAVNLMAAMDRLVLNRQPKELSQESIVRDAENIFDEDVAMAEALAQRGAELIHDGDSILTHCNSGGLVTAGCGTALGSVLRAHQQNKKIHVYVDETRPLLQGARLTTWELKRFGVPHTLICDNMAGFLMSQKRITKVFTGADRIARNGDFANKIGTYSVAVLAHFHKIPFYVVAPNTTFDSDCATGADIPVEERDADEVRGGMSPSNTDVWNPAFDVTPRSIISGIVLNDRTL